MLRFLAIGIVGMAALMTLGPYFVTFGRVFDKESKLYPGDERIAGITREMMRRSPELVANFIEFERCGIHCANNDRLIRERDAIIRRDWPKVLGYLTVRKDWGEARDSRIAREHFFKEVASHGAEGLRDKCVPKITYWHSIRGSKYEAHYRFEGFHCDKVTAPGRQARG